MVELVAEEMGKQRDQYCRLKIAAINTMPLYVAHVQRGDRITVTMLGIERVGWTYLKYFPIELQQLMGEKTKKHFRQITADELNFLHPLALPHFLL
jgi:acetamidase/formamidase